MPISAWVIDQGERLSALEYLEQNTLDCDREVWLYRVIGVTKGYRTTSASFELEHLTRDDPVLPIRSLRMWRYGWPDPCSDGSPHTVATRQAESRSN